jgi:hypothetical protein
LIDDDEVKDILLMVNVKKNVDEENKKRKRRG